MTDYLFSTLQISITEFFEKYVEGKTVTFYKIEVYDNYSKDSWILEKRYSEIDTLHKTLSKLYPNIPPMPGKTLFKIKDRDQLEKRKQQLEIFLKECSTRKDIVSNESFKAFMEIDKHSPDMTFNPPTIIYENNELPLGVRDCIYFEEASILFLVCCDMNITSRVDAYITNVNLPWEKKTNEHISVGAVFAFKVIGDKKGNSYYFEKLWAKSFPEQTGVVNFNKNDLVLQVGLDSGSIIFYKTSVESKYLAFDEIINYKPHSGRVMGLAYDELQGYIFSCSSDKKFKVTEYNNISCVTEVAESAFGYTALIHDKPNERLYLSTYNGHLEVYLTSTEVASFISDVDTSNNKYALNDLFPYNIKNYLFSCSDYGNISVFDLGKPGQEKTTKELSYFDYYNSKFKIKSVLYDPDNNQVISGDNYGRLIFWSLKYGKPIHVTKVSPSGKSIVRVRFIENSEEPNKLLLVSCLDNSVYFVKLPLKWVENEDIEKYEQVEIKARSDLDAMMKIQDYLNDDENYNSDEDSLNGWDYFANDAKEEQDKLKNKK